GFRGALLCRKPVSALRLSKNFCDSAKTAQQKLIFLPKRGMIDLYDLLAVCADVFVEYARVHNGT
ncbi:MAG: hypothetical protein II615_06730, partial [Ruminococcus sp.]|nr:hypothetical protein [Ruminococcus sp.]